jgi:hypothetical protein
MPNICFNLTPALPVQVKPVIRLAPVGAKEERESETAPVLFFSVNLSLPVAAAR